MELARSSSQTISIETLIKVLFYDINSQGHRISNSVVLILILLLLPTKFEPRVELIACRGDLTREREREREY